MAAPLIPNRSPVFSDTAVAIICQNDTTVSLNNAFDPDGDRLVYSFGTPYGNLGSTTTFPPLPSPAPYNAGYSGANPFGTGPGNFASINASTGIAKYGAMTNGLYGIAVDVSEYRTINGMEVFIGTTRRDLQLVVSTCPPTPPPILPAAITIPRSYTIEEGQSLSLPLSATQASNHPLVMTLNSALLDGTGGFNTTFNNNPGVVQAGNLTGTATATGTGSVSGTFQFNSVCGNSRANPYDIAVTVKDNGCGGKIVADIFRITVNRAVGPNAINGPAVVCDPVNTTTYTASGPTTATYRWRIVGGTIVGSSTGNAVQVQWNSSAATGTVVLKGVSTFGCLTDSVVSNVTISPLPALVVSPASVTICRGATTTLTVAAVAGQTYSWTGPGLPATSGTSVTVSPTVTTTYTVTATSGPCTITQQVTVTVSAPPTGNAGPNRIICSGQSTQLGVTPVAGVTYSWSPTTGLSNPNIANPTVTGTNTTGAPITTTYTLTATTVGGCVSTATVDVTVNPAPIATAGPAVSFCSGGSAQLGVMPVAGVTYSWSPSTGLSNPNIANPTVTGTNTTGAPVIITYALTATAVGGCTATATVAVTVNPAAVAVAGANVTFCSGGSAQLGGTAVAGTTYSWSPSTGLSNPNIANPTITGTNTTGTPIITTYTLTATTANNCTATATVQVTINPAPVAIAGANAMFCSGGSAQLGGSVVAGTTYTWSPTTGLSNPNIANPTVTGTNTTGTPIITTYTLTATAGSCSATATVQVTINPAAVATVGPAVSFCSGGSAQLGGAAVAGTTYSWSPATELSSTTVANPTVTGTNTTGAPIVTTYTLTATTANGCTATATVTVTVNPAPIAVAGANAMFCSGGSAQLGGPTVAGTTYSWSPTTGLSNPNIANPTVTGTNTTGTPIITTYTLTATTGPNCIATATVAVTVNPAAVAAAGPAVSFCSGGSVQLGVAPIAGTTYLWSPVTGLSDPNIANPTVTGTNTTGAPITTTYTLTATTGPGCMTTATVQVTVNPVPVAIAGANATFCSGGSAQLGGAAVPGTTYSWSPAMGLSNPNIANPTVTGTNTTGAPIITTYILTATAGPCTATATVTVTVNPAAVAIAGANTIFCSGGSAQLGGAAVAGTTYSWSPATGLSSTTVANPTVTGTNMTGAPIVTTYTLTATTANGCTATSTVAVTLNPAAVAVAGANAIFCSGGSAQLGGAAVAGTSYLWSPTTGLSSATVANPTVTSINTTGAPITTTYTLTATTGPGCTATATVTVTVNPAAVATAGPAVAFCSGGSAQLGVAPIAGTIYLWSPAAGLSSATVANPTVTLTNMTNAPITTTYTLTASTANTCTATATVAVTVNPTPQAFAGAARDVCSGLGTVLGAAPVAGYTYSWTPTTGLSSSTVANPTATLTNTTSANTTQTYTLTATNAQGCPATATVTVTVKPNPVADAGADRNLCSGETTTVGTPGIAGYTYSWTADPFLSNPNVAMPTYTPINTTGGSFFRDLVVIVRAPNGCDNTARVRITVNPAAVATAGPNVSVCSGLSAQLGGPAVAGTTYSWSPTTGLSSASAANPTVTLFNLTNTPTTTTYTLTATTADNCTATATVQVTVNPAAIAEAGRDVSICSGLSAVLGSVNVPGTSYLWSPATGLSSATVFNPTVTLTNTGTAPITQLYRLLTTTSNGCIARDSVLVTVDPAAVAVTGANATICSGATITLGGAAIAGTSYLWSPATGLSSATVANPTFTLANTTMTPNPVTYTLTATTASGCVATGNVTVTVNPAPVVSAGPNAALCADQTLTLGTPALAGYTYSWSPATNLSSATSAQPVFTAVNTTSVPFTRTYVLTGTTPQGCVATDTVVVTVNPRPQAALVSGPVSVCPTVTGIVYRASLLTNPTLPPFQWLVTGGTIAGSAQGDSIAVNWGTAGTGSVRVYYFNTQGCSSDTTALPVTINQLLRTPKPTGPGAVPGAAICQANGPYTYRVAPHAAGSLYSWQIVGGIQVSTGVSSVTVQWNPVTAPTVGLLIVTETSSTTSGVFCQGRPDTLRVNINPSPTTTLAITGPARVCQASGPVTFRLTGGFANSTYAFQLNGNSVTSTGNSLTLPNPPAPGAYVVSARETTVGGCAGPLYTFNFTVDPTPAPLTVSGPRFVCPENLTNHRYTVMGSTTSAFQWTVTGGTITAGQGTPAITVSFAAGTAPKTVSVAETSGFGCAGTTAGLVVQPDNAALALTVASVDVQSNSRIVLTFAASNAANTPGPVRIMRADAGSSSFAQVGTALPTATSYTDATPDAANRSYQYKLELTNGCGTVINSTPTNPTHTTIRLQATADPGTGGRNQGSVALSWNAYQGFAVQNYSIYRQDDAGQPVLVTTVPAGTLTFNTPNSGLGFEQCFRIVATSATSSAISSNSNLACVKFEGKVATYNVITPNRDGLNDVLVIDNIKLYPGSSVTIFNRWGREVFNTTNYQNNWGSDDNVAAGVYYYLLKLPNGTSTKGWVEVVR